MTENSEKLTWKVVVFTRQSRVRVMGADMKLDDQSVMPCARTDFSYVDQGFRPTWRVE